MDGNSGYLSHSLYPLYFGLGAADAVDSIEVTWPSGKKQTVQPPFTMNSRSMRSVRRAVELTRRGPRATTASLVDGLPSASPAGSPRRRTRGACGTNCASKRGSGGSSVFASLRRSSREIVDVAVDERAPHARRRR